MAKYQRDRYRSDPVYREQVKEAARKRVLDRYHNDPEFRERQKAASAARAVKKADEIREYQKKYKEANKEKIREYGRIRQLTQYEYNTEFREKKKAGMRAIYGTESHREYAKAYRSMKRSSDLNFKLADNLRSRLRDALHGRSKSAHTLELLGCTLDFFKGYIEAQFQPGMTWENWSYEGWHLDHERALANFDLSDPKQQSEAFHYTNIQPMWGKENIAKSDGG